jgi:hypothetical protein
MPEEYYNGASGGTRNDAFVSHGQGKTAMQIFNGSTWCYGGNSITSFRGPAGAGSPNAALAFGAEFCSPTGYSEEYDGVSWALGGTPTARVNASGGGTQNNAIAAGGQLCNTILTSTQEYNGTSWSAGGNLVIAQHSANRSSHISSNKTDAFMAGGFAGFSLATYQYGFPVIGKCFA